MEHRRKWGTRTNKTENNNIHIIGPYTHGKEIEKETDKDYTTHVKHNMIPMNAWERPQLNMQEKTQLKWEIKKRKYEEALQKYKTKQ